MQKHNIQHNGTIVSSAELVAGWREDESFRDFFISLLAAAPFPAFFWETPAITTATMSQPFEFVLINSPVLVAQHSDPLAFAAQFRDAGDNNGIAAFRNLGGDALLVVPCPLVLESIYAHLATFSRAAPPSQQHALWRRVGESVAASISTKPLWVSTSGLGVNWLHVRLDSRPKYYNYQPYRKAVL